MSSKHFPLLDHASARKEMVASQLESRGISDSRTLAAFRRIPRHLFVRQEDRADVYGDHPLPIGQGQTLSQPFVVAYMIQALRLQPKYRVLEVGTGSGYQTAILAELVRSVYTIEYFKKLAKAAQGLLTELSYENISFAVGNGTDGWVKKNVEFDAIIVSAAPQKIPTRLVEQLAPGGQLIIPIGTRRQQLTLVHRSERSDQPLENRTLLPVRFVPMLGA